MLQLPDLELISYRGAIKDVIMRMLETDPNKRPTAKEVKEFITEQKPNTNYNISTLSQQGEIWIQKYFILYE